jgi:hypothetical protein
MAAIRGVGWSVQPSPELGSSGNGPCLDVKWRNYTTALLVRLCSPRIQKTLANERGHVAEETVNNPAAQLFQKHLFTEHQILLAAQKMCTAVRCLNLTA